MIERKKKTVVEFFVLGRINMGKKTKKKDITLEDVKNMKLDPDFCLLDCFLRISLNASKKQEEEEKLRASPTLCTPEKEKCPLDDELVGQVNLTLGSPSVIDISEGKRTMKEENIIAVKKLVRSTGRKMMAQTRRDITYDDMKDYRVSPYMSKFDHLVRVGERGWEIAEEEDCKLMISSPRKEEFCCPSPAVAFKSKKMMRQNNSLVINDSIDHEKMMKENTVKKPVAKYPDDMSREDKLKRERLLKKPVVEEIPKKGSVNQRIWFESEDTEEEEEEDGKAMKKKKTTNKGCKKGVHKSPDYIPDLPDEVNEWIRRKNGSEAKLVIQKQLYTTDLSRGQNRISMPFNQLHQPDFLIEIEKELLKKKTPDKKNRMGIDVLFIEPNGEQNFDLVLKRWDMPKEDGHSMSSMYVFIGKWHDLCKKYKLEKGTIVQIWSFRYDGKKLGFAMVIVDRGPNGSGTSKGGDGNGNGNDNGSNESQSSDNTGKSGSSFNTNKND